jgi:Zonular occludens toxin (Zot)
MSNLVCYIGLFGSGKSFALVGRTIELAEKGKLMIVSNIWFDVRYYVAYCQAMGYKWAAKCRLIYYDLLMGNIVDMRTRRRLGDANVASMISDYPNSVILFDEAGIHLNARFWKNTGKEFLSSLFQLRHDNKTLLCGYQFYEQVDKQLREVIQLVVDCTSLAPKDKSGRPRLVAYYRHYYEPLRFSKIIFENPSALQRWIWALKVEWRFLAIASFRYWITKRRSHPQYLVFKIYDSFVPSKRKKYQPYIVWEEPARTGFLF